MAGLYAAPFAEFIARRDALAKELRAAGDRDAASALKRMRKPSRAAWALDRVVHVRPESLAALDAAVGEYVDAQAGGGDVRAAMTGLRASIRAYAELAAAEARDAGFALVEGELSNAVLAVLGSPDSYEELRRGCIADIPDAGGLDFLSSLPARPRLVVSAPHAQAPATPDPAVLAQLRERAEQCRAAAEHARSAAVAADDALTQADAAVAAARIRVEEARSELTAAEQRREFARRTKESASAELREAEAASREAGRRLGTAETG